MKFSKISRFAPIAALFVGIFIFQPAMAEEEKPAGTEKKIAVVNGVVISQIQFDKELKIYLDRVARQGQQVSDDRLAALKKDVLEGLIERELLYQKSRKVGVQITDQAVDEQLAQIKKRFPGEQDYKNALSAMNLTEDEVKNQIAHGLAIRELINQEIMSNITVSDKESKTFYDAHPQIFKEPEQVKASHILIKVEADATDAQKAEARKKINDIQQKLKAGGDFADLAKEFSEGPSNVRGGDLGYFRRGQMVKPFEDAAFAMQINEVSDVVETRFGYHLIKVYDKKPEQIVAYADVKEKLGQRMKQEKAEKEAAQYIEQLKKDATIEKF
ncbi:MAG: peptidylprolyl isomerase [Desulfobacterales bacterium]|jgi:peptidyl-prolyl cis-trans isomerase C